MCSVGQNLPQKARRGGCHFASEGGGSGCVLDSAEPKGCLKAARIDPGPLPLLRGGHCCPGDLAFHSHPGGERGN